jgi:ATP-dependent protease HslVU (ClpYQ) peptidase subunit
MTVVNRDGSVMRYEGAWPIPIEDRQFAMGSGRDYARAAMHLGCSAAEAVAVACEFDENCGNGIDTLVFLDL